MLLRLKLKSVTSANIWQVDPAAHGTPAQTPDYAAQMIAVQDISLIFVITVKLLDVGNAFQARQQTFTITADPDTGLVAVDVLYVGVGIVLPALNALQALILQVGAEPKSTGLFPV